MRKGIYGTSMMQATKLQEWLSHVDQVGRPTMVLIIAWKSDLFSEKDRS